MQMQAHADAAAEHYEVYGGAEDEEGNSIMERDSDGEEQDEGMYEDDLSSELSVPDESINFDLVYSLHSFAATVEGQANVVKGDSLILMDDSNSYWWLVKVLKTQEVGYIPAENIETPFERLARLNKHRNVDVSILLIRLSKKINKKDVRATRSLSPVPYHHRSDVYIVLAGLCNPARQGRFRPGLFPPQCRLTIRQSKIAFPSASQN